MHYQILLQTYFKKSQEPRAYEKLRALENTIHEMKQKKINSSINKENNVTFSNMDGTRDSHTKWNNSGERQISYGITYIWNLIFDTNEPFYGKETHREQTCGCQGEESGMN